MGGLSSCAAPAPAIMLHARVRPALRRRARPSHHAACACAPCLAASCPPWPSCCMRVCALPCRAAPAPATMLRCEYVQDPGGLGHGPWGDFLGPQVWALRGRWTEGGEAHAHLPPNLSHAPAACPCPHLRCPACGSCSLPSLPCAHAPRRCECPSYCPGVCDCMHWLSRLGRWPGLCYLAHTPWLPGPSVSWLAGELGLAPGRMPQPQPWLPGCLAHTPWRPRPWLAEWGACAVRHLMRPSSGPSCLRSLPLRQPWLL